MSDDGHSREVDESGPPATGTPVKGDVPPSGAGADGWSAPPPPEGAVAAPLPPPPGWGAAGASPSLSPPPPRASSQAFGMSGSSTRPDDSAAAIDPAGLDGPAPDVPADAPDTPVPASERPAPPDAPDVHPPAADEPAMPDAPADQAAVADPPGEEAPSASEPAEPPWQLTPTPPWPPATPPPGTPAVGVGPPPPGVAPVPPAVPAAPPMPAAPPVPPGYAPGPAGPPPAPPMAPPGYGYGYAPPAGPAPAGYGGAVAFGGPGGPVVIDPHGLGLSVSRLSGAGRRVGKVALAVLATVLEEGDVVAVVVQGRFRGEPGVAALVEGKVVLVNDRQWKPDVVVLAVDADLAVHGWQDERTAALTFVSGERQEFIERIGDRGLAIEFAQRVRHALGGPEAGMHLPPVPPPPAMPG